MTLAFLVYGLLFWSYLIYVCNGDRISRWREIKVRVPEARVVKR